MSISSSQVKFKRERALKGRFVSILILICFVISAVEGQRGRPPVRQQYSDDDFDDDYDDFDYDDEPTRIDPRERHSTGLPRAPPPPRDDLQDFADERSSNFGAPTMSKPSPYQQIATMSDKLPLAQQLQYKQRLLKLGIFSEQVQEWIRKEAKVSSPMDSVIFGILFIFMAYLPSLILSLLYASFFAEEQQITYPPSLFRHNDPDSLDIKNILNAVNAIKKNVDELQGNSSGG